MKKIFSIIPILLFSALSLVGASKIDNSTLDKLFANANLQSTEVTSQKESKDTSHVEKGVTMTTDTTSVDQGENDIGSNIINRSLSDSPNLFLWIAIFLEGILLVVITLMYVFSLREKIIRVVTDSDRIKTYLKNIIRENSSNRNEVRAFSKRDIDAIISTVFAEVMDKINFNTKDHAANERNNALSHDSSTELLLNHKEQIKTVKYLKEKSEDSLSFETNNESEAKFKLMLISNENADFEFVGKANDFASSDYFDNVCEFANNPSELSSITLVRTIERGNVELQPNGKWKVTKKAKIKFE